MRWLMLYARSRQVPVSAAAVVLVALAVGALDGGGPDPMDLGTAVLVLAVNAVAASVGLAGHDVVLERTAAIRWYPRRALHVLLIGVFAGAALVALQAAGTGFTPAEFVVRDSAGLAGLTALGAVVWGAQFAWTLPTGWLAVTLLSPPPAGAAGEVVHWMTFSPATTVSTWTAWGLLAVGTAAYAVAGPRR